MTHQQLNLALAKWNGWYEIRTDKGGFVAWAIDTGGDDDTWSQTVPDYVNDLNLVHQCEKALTDETRWQYQSHLDKICATSKDPHCSCWDFIHATALQRCEALARTLGIWEDEQ